MGSSKQQGHEKVLTETIGSRLRRERLAKHITLEEVAETTRVNIKTLQALEGDDKNRLPARVFVQGFIRLYAKHIGLDPEEALAQYVIDEDDTLDSTSKINVKKILASESMAESPSILTSKQLLFIVLLVLLGFLIYLGRQNYTFTQPQTETVTEQTPETPAAQPEPTQMQTDNETAVSETLESETVESEIAASEAFVSDTSDTHTKDPMDISEELPALAQSVPEPQEKPIAPQMHILKAFFTEQTWVWIRVDENEPKEYIFRAGQKYTWKAFHKFDINVGNAGGVELSLNNKKISDLGVSGQVVRFTMPEATRTLLQDSDDY